VHPNAILHEIRQLYNVSDRLHSDWNNEGAAISGHERSQTGDGLRNYSMDGSKVDRLGTGRLKMTLGSGSS